MNTVTFRWQDRRGVWHTESMPRGYADSRIVALQHMGRPVEIVRHHVRTFDIVDYFREHYRRANLRRSWAAWAEENAWEDAGRLDDIQADLEAQS